MPNNIQRNYFIPCKQPTLGPNGEGRNVPRIRLGLELGTALIGAALAFKGKRVPGAILATLGTATALGEIRVIRNLGSHSIEQSQANATGNVRGTVERLIANAQEGEYCILPDSELNEEGNEGFWFGISKPDSQKVIFAFAQTANGFVQLPNTCTVNGQTGEHNCYTWSSVDNLVSTNGGTTNLVSEQ